MSSKQWDAEELNRMMEYALLEGVLKTRQKMPATVQPALFPAAAAVEHDLIGKQ